MTGRPRALLSFAGPGAGGQPVAAPQSSAPLFAGSVVSWQAEQLLAAGVTHFLIAVDPMVGAAVQLGEQLRDAGATVDFVRSPAELSAMLAAGDRIAVVAEGLWCDASLVRDLVALPGEAVVVIDDSSGTAPFERIDVGHRWAGLALVSGATAATLADLPADWSIESALMRQALRRGASRVIVPSGAGVDAALALVTDAGVAAGIERRVLRKAGDAAGPSPVERGLFAPLSRAILPSAWRGRVAAIAIDAAGPALAMLAVALGGWGAPLLACGAGFAALAGRAVRRAKSALHPRPQIDRWLDGATFGLLGLAIAAVVGVEGALNWMQLAAALLLAGLVATLRLTVMPGDWDRWKPGPAEVALVLGAGAALNSAMWGWWAATLACVALLLADRLMAPGQPGLKPN